MSLKTSLAGDDKSRGGLNFKLFDPFIRTACLMRYHLQAIISLHAVHYHILVCYCCPDETYYLLLASGYYTYTGAIWKKMKYGDSILSSAPGGRIHSAEYQVQSAVQHFVHGTISISTGVDCSSKPIRNPSLNSFLATERPSLYRIAASASSNLIPFKSILLSASI